MARTLYEIIKANEAAGATAAPQRTADFRQAILAKSGQAQAPGLASGPQKSTIAETAAIQQGQAQQQVLNVAEQQQGMALGQEQRAVTQDIAIQNRKLNTASEDQRTRYLTQVSNIAQQLERDVGQIDVARRNAQIEQAGFLLGLSNKKYVQELEQTANLRGLWDQAKFDQELFKSSLDADYDLYVQDRDYQRFFNASQRDFQIELAKMGINEKLDLMTRQLQAENRRAVAQGATQAASEVATYKSKPSTQTTTEAAPTAGATSTTPATTSTTTRSTGVIPKE